MKKELIFFCVFIVSVKIFAQDPYSNYLHDISPIINKIISVKDTLGIIQKEITFKFDDSSAVRLIVCTPPKKGKYPGILILHGGGGLAEKEKAMAWAQRGYIAVAPDLPGIAEPGKLTYTQGRWNRLKYGESRWTANPDIRSSVIYDAVVCALQSLNYLRTQPGVDKDRIGVVGISWGGYMTTMVCALAGKRVKAGFSVYGCGFYELTSSISNLNKMPQSERKEWIKYLDPGSWIKNMTASYFVAGATNDFFFYPKAVQKTLDSIPSEKNHVYAPNVNHQMPVPGGSVFDSRAANDNFVPTVFQPYPTPKGGNANWLAMEVDYMSYHLKDMGVDFPKVTVLSSKDLSKAKFEIKTSERISKVEVYFSNQCSDVKKCEWKALVPTEIGKNTYEFDLKPEIQDWFVLVSNDRPISVSSDLVSR